MADLRIVPLGPQDRDEVMRLDQAAFALDPVEFDAAGELDFLEWDRTWGAVRPAAGPVRHTTSGSWGEQEELAGQYTSFSMQLTVPGSGTSGESRRTPMAGLSWVAVHPDHRRRGILTAMMRHHLQDLHDGGREAVAGLFASESVIYQRFGYGDSAGGVVLTLPQGAELRSLPLGDDGSDITTQLTAVGPEGDLAELVAEIYERSATRPGRVSRSLPMTRELLRDRPWRHRGGEPTRIVVARRHGRATGYALMRRMPKWDDGSPTGVVIVAEVMGDDAATLHALWTRVLGFDLMTKVETPTLGLDDPLLEWLVDIRGAKARREDALWLRLVDVDRALMARGYAADVDVVLAVEDDLCPWNAGHWRLTVRDGEATCAATGEPADLTVAVRDLAASYLGGHSLAALERAGLVLEQTPGSVGALSAAMRGVVGPAVPQMF